MLQQKHMLCIYMHMYRLYVYILHITHYKYIYISTRRYDQSLFVATQGVTETWTRRVCRTLCSESHCRPSYQGVSTMDLWPQEDKNKKHTCWK